MLSLMTVLMFAPAAPIHSTRCEVTVTAATQPADADLVAVKVEFSNGMVKVAAPGFWDGGAVWKARAKLTPGTWSYRVSAHPAVAGLDGASGTILAPEAPRTEFDRRGPIRVAPSGTHFTYGDGTKFFWLGDTVWNGPLLSSASDWDHYLTLRQRQRFSVIQFVMVAPWRGTPADADGQRAFVRRERVEISPEFFRRMDERIDAINRKGLLAAPVILWALAGADNPGWTFSDNQAAFVAKYVVNRYHAHDVAWLLAGDGKYDAPDSVARWSKIAHAAFGDTPEAPVSLYPAAMTWPFEQYRKEPWLGFCGYQSGQGDNDAALAWTHSGPPAQSWKNEPIKPVLNLGLPYESHVAQNSNVPFTEIQVRRSIWWGLLSTPIAGLTYGTQGVWSWQMFPGIPKNYPESGLAPAWHQAMDRPSTRQLIMLRDFLDTVSWTELRPAQELLAVQPGARVPERFISIAKSGKSDLILAYIPEGSGIKLKPEAASGGAIAAWYDPRTGQTGASFPAATELRTPDAKDWVLIVRKK